MFSISTGAAIMQQSASRLAMVATNVANAQTPNYQKFDTGTGYAAEPLGQSTADSTAPTLTYSLTSIPRVDLAQEMVNLAALSDMYAIGAKLFEAEGQMAQETLSIKA